eukprot:g15080.t1
MYSRGRSVRSREGGKTTSRSKPTNDGETTSTSSRDKPASDSDSDKVEPTSTSTNRFFEVNSFSIRLKCILIIDTCIDFFCTAMPLFITFFVYNVPTPIDEITLIVVFPACMMLLKLETILEEIIRYRTANALLRAQESIASSASRMRKSIFSDIRLFELAKEQQASIPYPIHIGAAAVKLVFGMVFLAIAILHLATFRNAECDRTAILRWESRCLVKTFFCKSTFEPRCNCAVLKVQGHNWTELPTSILRMNALKVLQINYGPLSIMDPGVDMHLKKLAVLDLSHNNLTYIPSAVGQLALSAIKLANNNLQGVPDSIWRHNNIHWLELDNNNISEIPAAIKNAKSLASLLVSNNSLTEVPVELFSLNIVGLSLDGNKLRGLPDRIGEMKTLRTLMLNNNNITTVTNAIGQLVNVYTIDLRNNNIHQIHDAAVANLMSLQYMYVHKNPLCSNGWLDVASIAKTVIDESDNRGAGCRPQCSLFCHDRLLPASSRKYCARECNSRECRFDGGRCEA